VVETKPERDGVDALLAKRCRGRNVAMLVVLLALCALFYAITIVKLAGEAADNRSGGGEGHIVSGVR
jgi:hypothetical protein